jgi:nitrite reductase/ring-hydroxylating ferredoxin subunit
MKKLKFKSNLRFFLIIALLLFAFVQCDETDTRFPYVSVYVKLSLDTQLGNMPVGQYKEISGYGLGGLIIYRNDYNEFQAFDRACTYEASSECKIKDEVSIFTCPCCESQFIMTGEIAGSVFQGPANQALRQYNCYFDGLNTITVSN